MGRRVVNAGITVDSGTAWSDDPAFWEAMEPALCADARVARAEGDVADIDTCVGLAPGARVLDLACRPGGHAIALARRGRRLTAVDASRRLRPAKPGASWRTFAPAWREAEAWSFQVTQRLYSGIELRGLLLLSDSRACAWPVGSTAGRLMMKALDGWWRSHGRRRASE